MLLTRRQKFRRFASAVLVAMVVATGLSAGPLPNLLDDNRGDVALAAIETGAFNLAIGALAPVFLNPVSPAFMYPPVLSGRVLANPQIHNLYMDSDWDSHNPDAPTRSQLDALTQQLVGSGYFSEAGQYGVGSASFTGSHEREVLCGLFEPINGGAEFVQILAWVTCMAGYNPFAAPPSLLPPGSLDPISGVPAGNDNSLYVVYLPRDVEIVEGGCGSFKAYHFFTAVPDIDVIFTPLPIPVPRAQTVAFAVVQTKCMSGATPQALRNDIFNAATHEIMEAALDPIVGTGWINNSVISEAEGDGFFDQLAASFNAINLDLKVGEAADICSAGGTETDPPASQHPTNPIPVPTSDGSLGGFFLVAPYWSNSPEGCAPFVPKTTLEFGTPHFGQFVTSATTMTISAVDGGSGTGVASIKWRVFADGSDPPDFTTGPVPVTFNVTGGDGGYTVEMSATGNNGMVEVVHSSHLILDNTAPVITINEPTATSYPHSAVLTLDYSASDGLGSGVASLTATLDGSSTLAGHGLADGQAINLLFELPLGDHTFVATSDDRVTNESQKSVTFSIIVTPDSIKQDVQIFVDAGLIKDPGIPTALLAKLNIAADFFAAGDCAKAAQHYQTFIKLIQAQTPDHIDPTAAAIMIADAEYLIAHCL